VTFDARVTWIEDCTKDADALVRGFRGLRVSERQTKARLLDATSSAIDHLARRENVRRVLLLISETRDRGSETKADVVIGAAQLAGVTIYAMSYSAFATASASKAPVGEQKPAPTPTTPSEAYGTHNGQPPGKFNARVPPPEQRIDYLGAIREAAHMRHKNVADALTKSTGGAEFSFARRKALETAIRKLGADLHSQYVLTFMPDSTEPGYHELKIRVTGRGADRVRARPGYPTLDGGK
jgi:VWFA-related protein